MSTLTWVLVDEKNRPPECGARSSSRVSAMFCELPPDHMVGEAGHWPFHHGRDRLGRWRSWSNEGSKGVAWRVTR